MGVDMGHEHFVEPLALGSLTRALLASGVLACSVVDDEPPIGDTGQTEHACQEQLETLEAACLPGMRLELMFEGGGGSIILIDDPGATVGVGPDAWLVQVGAEADYVASQQLDGVTCTGGCGWCARGESVCHQGLDESGAPIGCLMCLPYGVPDVGTQCATFMAACAGLDETGAEDDGVDETGAGDDGDDGDDGDEDVDETGAESDSGALQLADPDAFDCRNWDLDGAVVSGMRGDVIVDAAVVEMAAAHLGEPLAKCDGTRFRRRSDGYFEISALAASGLLSRIGLEQGDILFAIDGESMHGADRIVSKAMDLFMGGRPTSEVTLVVFRGAEAIDKVVHIR